MCSSDLIFSHRGYFLNYSLDTGNETWDFSTSYSALIETLKVVGVNGMPETVDLKELQRILGKKDCSRSAILEEVSQLFNISKKEKQLYSILKLFSGLTIKAFELTGNENLKKEEKNFSPPSVTALRLKIDAGASVGFARNGA